MIKTVCEHQKVSQFGFFKRAKALHTILKPQLPKIQGTLEDVTPAWLIFSRHQHQVVVDKDSNLKQTEGGEDSRRRNRMFEGRQRRAEGDESRQIWRCLPWSHCGFYILQVHL